MPSIPILSIRYSAQSNFTQEWMQTNKYKKNREEEEGINERFFLCAYMRGDHLPTCLPLPMGTITFQLYHSECSKIYVARIDIGALFLCDCIFSFRQNIYVLL